MKKKVRYLLVAIIVLTALCGLNTFAASKTVELKNKKSYIQDGYPEGVNENDTIYHKIVVPRTGYLTIYGAQYSDYGYSSNLYFRFTNSKKQTLHSNVYCHTSETDSYRPCAYIAVTKGTYYVAVKGVKRYQILYHFQSVNEKSGSKQSKAVKISRGKTIKGLLKRKETNKKYDWYKIVLSSKRKLKITFTSGSSSAGYVWCQLVPANKRMIISNSIMSTRDQQGVFTTKNSLPKGTYYLKVYKGTNIGKNDSAFYSIKWQ